jgi:hypothetical protein
VPAVTIIKAAGFNSSDWWSQMSFCFIFGVVSEGIWHCLTAVYFSLLQVTEYISEETKLST